MQSVNSNIQIFTDPNSLTQAAATQFIQLAKEANRITR